MKRRKLKSGSVREDGAPYGALPAGYAAFLADIKQRVRTAQVRAVLATNREMILLYWEIGRLILDRQSAQGWGAKVVERLAADLKLEFSEMRGFSPRNLKYMRAFAEAWPDMAFVQQVAAQMPWFHNCLLLDKLGDRTARMWYMRQTIEQGWSRNILAIQIESDLLFYHLKLRCFVVIDLKSSEFKPEYAGKMNFYLSAVDDLLRHSDDKPTIGLLLCKEKDKLTVEYALRDVKKPIGVAAWRTRLVESLPKRLKGQLPTVEEIEAELESGKIKTGKVKNR